jgi:hypothetical protein
MKKIKIPGVPSAAMNLIGATPEQLRMHHVPIVLQPHNTFNTPPKRPAYVSKYKLEILEKIAGSYKVAWIFWGGYETRAKLTQAIRRLRKAGTVDRIRITEDL